MNQYIDSKIRERLLDNDIDMPKEYRKKVDEAIHALPDNVSKKWRMRFQSAAVIAVVCLLLTSITVFAAVDHIKQRMDRLSEEEKDELYDGLQNSSANADSYSREFTDSEKEKIEQQKVMYKSGTFPIQKLPVIRTQGEADGSNEFYFVEDTSLFVIPERELTDDEILRLIDFYYCRDYSLTEKANENIVSESANMIIEEGKMDEQKALEMAKLDIKNAYGIDCDGFETSVAYNNVEGNGNFYVVSMTDKATSTKYGVSIDADLELVTDIFNLQQNNNIAEGIEVDEVKFTAKYEEALDLLRKWKGIDLPIIKSSYEYNYNSDNCLEYGMVSYSFEMKDGSGYVLYYSCVNDVFFQGFMTDYNQYRQRIEQDEAKRQARGIDRKIIQMQD